jgi:hypothetical protein
MGAMSDVEEDGGVFEPVCDMRKEEMNGAMLSQVI